MKSLEIEKALENIDQIRFEGMINNLVKYIYKLDDSFHIQKIGMTHGKLRTRKGTPDIKIISAHENIAIECSVEKNIEPKIDRDIKKCISTFEKEKVTLHEICFCYNGNVSTKKINEITERLKSKLITFKFVGIDDIANILYLECPIVAQDWLNIKMSNGSLVPLKDYKSTDRFKFDHETNFLYRDKDVKQIINLLDESFVLISGKAGDGKTRLALEVANIWSSIGTNEAYVLDNNAYEFDEDFNRFLFLGDSKKLLVIDDINRLSVLDRVISLLELRDTKKSIHILATVRDYAENSIMTRYFKLFNLYKLESLSREEITKIISEKFKISNVKYLDYILKVSKGNLRFSIMAAKTMTQSKNAIPSIPMIIETYYNSITRDLSIDEGNVNPNLLKTLGIFSFFQKINISDINGTFVQKILKTFKIKIDDFRWAINYWDNKEILKYRFDNKIVSMDDQILRTYIFKRVFIDNEYLQLYDLIKIFFESNIGNIVDIINSLNYVYGPQEKISDVILKIQKELFNSNDKLLFSYLQSLQLVNPETSVEMIQKLIEKGQFDYISLLLSYCETNYFKEALDIIFAKYNNIDDKLRLVINKGIVDSFIPNRYSFDRNYESQILLIKKLIELDESFNELILNIIKSHCNFVFQSTESEKMSLSIYTSSLGWNAGVKEYRKLLWELIKKIYTSLKDEKLGTLYKSLTHYNGLNAAQETKQLEFELYEGFIKKIIPSNTYKKLLKFELSKFYCIISKKELKSIYDFEKDKLLNILFIEENRIFRKNQKKDELMILLKQFDKKDFSDLIKELSKAIIFYEEDNKWHINNIISNLFEICNNNINQFDILKLLNRFIPDLDLRPQYIMHNFSEKFSMSKIRMFLLKSNFKYKWDWILATFMFEREVNEELYNQCLEHFRNITYITNFCGGGGSLNLKQFFDFNKNFYIDITNIVIAKDSVNLLFLFDELFCSEYFDLTIQLYSNDINVLVNLYFKMLEKHLHIDYEKKFIDYFITINNDNFARYLNIVKHESLSFIWERKDAESLVYDYCEKLFKDENKYFYRFALEDILSGAENSIRMKIIENLGKKYFDNHIIMFELSCLVSDYNKEMQKQFIMFLINNNYPPEEFAKLSIASGPHSWFGSEVPIIRENIELLDTLILNLKDFPEYVKRLRQFKQWRENEIKRVMVEEFNSGYFTDV